SSWRSAALTRAKTPAQSPGRPWRKRRARRYQRQSSPPRPQRQSGRCESSSQTGRPSAPARWGIAVSEVITRSRVERAAAVSRNAEGDEDGDGDEDEDGGSGRSRVAARSSIGSEGGRADICSRPSAFCRTKKQAPSGAAASISGTKRAS